MKREYHIGEAAQLLNVSRDTLRFYEKKKLLTPKKEENGYRSYSEEDIRMLLDLIFWRKLECSIQDIQSIFEEGTLEHMHEFLTQRIIQEEEEIKRHQKNLGHLIVTRHTRKKIMNHLHQYSLQTIPKTYIFSTRARDYDTVRDAWFQAVAEDKGLENCYLHEQLIPQKNGSYERQYYLVLEESAVKTLNIEEKAKNTPFFSFPQCVHYIYASDTFSPRDEDIQAMIEWADNQGIELSGEVHAHYLWNHYQYGRLSRSYVELYMPVLI